MSITDYYRKALIHLSETFSASALECIDIFFSKKGSIKMPWEVVEQLQSTFDLIVTLGCSNRDHSALMYAGIQYDSFRSFVGYDTPDITEASDILGEFINSYSGIICDNPAFSREFGVLTPSVPVIYRDGQSYLPFMWGIQGYIHVEMQWIYIGYTICKNRKEFSEKRFYEVSGTFS